MASGVEREFVATCYEIFLGRDADADGVLVERSRWQLPDIVASFIVSEEFGAVVVAPIAAGEPLPPWLFQDRLTVRHRCWVVDHLPLLGRTANAIARARDWRALLTLLVGDPVLMALGHRAPVQPADRGTAHPVHLFGDPIEASAGPHFIDDHMRRMMPRYHCHLLDRFESLGDNCEVGGLQRLAGIERISLFRWSGASLPILVDLLDRDLAGLDDPAHMRLWAWTRTEQDREYMLWHDLLQCDSHTFRHPDEIAEGELLRQEAARLRLLKRKFLEDAAAGRRIFIHRTPRPLSDADARRLHRALARFGPNRLLCVHLSDPLLAPGEVRLIDPGLAIGALEVMAVGMELHSELWPVLLRRALHLLDDQPALTREAA